MYKEIIWDESSEKYAYKRKKNDEVETYEDDEIMSTLGLTNKHEIFFTCVGYAATKENFEKSLIYKTINEGYKTGIKSDNLKIVVVDGKEICDANLIDGEFIKSSLYSLSQEEQLPNLEEYIDGINRGVSVIDDTLPYFGVNGKYYLIIFLISRRQLHKLMENLTKEFPEYQFSLKEEYTDIKVVGVKLKSFEELKEIVTVESTYIKNNDIFDKEEKDFFSRLNEFCGVKDLLETDKTNYEDRDNLLKMNGNREKLCNE